MRMAASWISPASRCTEQPAPAQQGPSNQPQQHQQSVAHDKNAGQKGQEKDKGDKKDGGGGGGPDHN